MIKKSLYVLITLMVFSSCKKDRLEGDRSIFEGKWEWAYSIKTKIYSNSSTPSITDTIYPFDVSSTFGLEFMSEGKVRFIENGETTEEYRTVITAFTSEGVCHSTFGSEVYQYVILPNNEEEIHFNGCVSADTMTFHNKDFPFPRYSGSGTTITHKNFFKKVN